MEIKFGYCCVSMLYPQLKCGRSSTKTYLDSHDKSHCHDYLFTKAKNNLLDLGTLLRENNRNAIEAYRVPEQLLPQIDLGYYQVKELTLWLEEAGGVANMFQMQLSNHPSQYFVLNSLREEVVVKTIGTIDLIAETFQRMNLACTPNIILHVGVKNGYETVDDALRGFVRNYNKLSEAARSYLVVENDPTSFTVGDCLKIHEQIGIPVVFDNMHFKWNKGELGFGEAVKQVVPTWGSRIPKFHLSSEKGGRRHSHSDYIAVEDYKELEWAVSKTNIGKCYFMLECKEKDRAIIQLRDDLMRN